MRGLPCASAETIRGAMADAHAVKNRLRLAGKETFGGDKVFGVYFVLAGVNVKHEKLAFVARRDVPADLRVVKNLSTGGDFLWREGWGVHGVISLGAALTAGASS